MAENFFIHFATATWDELVPWLDQRTFRNGSRLSWSYPGDCYAVLLYEYPDLELEYETVELERLEMKLGRMPSLSLCLELRRSLGSQACDVAGELTRDLLKTFAGVADDGWGDDPFWMLAELDGESFSSRGCFLDCYRSID